MMAKESTPSSPSQKGDDDKDSKKVNSIINNGSDDSTAKMVTTTCRSSSSSSSMIPVTLKWSKKTFECTLDPNRSALDFKATIQQLTGVPIHRQKLIATNNKGKHGAVYWKGPLSDDYDLGQILQRQQHDSLLTVTLMGSAEVLTEPTVVTNKFLEDLTPLQLQAAEHAQLLEAMKTARGGMIPAVQLPPHQRHADHKKTELYQYNHLVQGLPQAQIENLLLEQQQPQPQPQQQPQQREEQEATRSNNEEKKNYYGYCCYCYCNNNHNKHVVVGQGCHDPGTRTASGLYQ
jgi:hypothetical protein